MQLEQKCKDLESARISLQDGEIATGVVLSLQARIVHLEHLNSKYEVSANFDEHNQWLVQGLDISGLFTCFHENGSLNCRELCINH